MEKLLLIFAILVGLWCDSAKGDGPFKVAVLDTEYATFMDIQGHPGDPDLKVGFVTYFKIASDMESVPENTELHDFLSKLSKSVGGANKKEENPPQVRTIAYRLLLLSGDSDALGIVSLASDMPKALTEDAISHLKNIVFYEDIWEPTQGIYQKNTASEEGGWIDSEIGSNQLYNIAKRLAPELAPK